MSRQQGIRVNVRESTLCLVHYRSVAPVWLESALATCQLSVRDNSAFCDAAGSARRVRTRSSGSSGGRSVRRPCSCLVVRKPLLVVVACALSLTRRASPVYPGAEFPRCGSELLPQTALTPRRSPGGIPVSVEATGHRKRMVPTPRTGCHHGYRCNCAASAPISARPHKGAVTPSQCGDTALDSTSHMP
jgi:hypothetical protein